MTPSEAGAFAAVYAIFVGVFIYKELTWESFKETLKYSILDIGSIMFIIAISGIFGYGIVYDRVALKLAAFLTIITQNPILILLIIVGFLIISGMFVESTVCALLLTPILLPIVTRIGVDPVHFGIIMMTILVMGIMTPPVGVAMYAVSYVIGRPPEETIKESLPFFIAIMIVVVIIVFIPNLVLFLPNLIFG